MRPFYVLAFTVLYSCEALPRPVPPPPSPSKVIRHSQEHAKKTETTTRFKLKNSQAKFIYFIFSLAAYKGHDPFEPKQWYYRLDLDTHLLEPLKKTKLWLSRIDGKENIEVYLPEIQKCSSDTVSRIRSLITKNHFCETKRNTDNPIICGRAFSKPHAAIAYSEKPARGFDLGIKSSSRCYRKKKIDFCEDGNNYKLMENLYRCLLSNRPEIFPLIEYYRPHS